MSLLNSGSALSSGLNVYGSSGISPRAFAGSWLGDLRLGIWVGLFAQAVLSPVLRRRHKRPMRFGALGVIIAETGIFCLRDMPPVPDASAWYAQAPLLGYAVLAGLTMYAARLAAGSGTSSGGVTQV